MKAQFRSELEQHVLGLHSYSEVLATIAGVGNQL